ncbi:MAG: hypothetical protein ACHQD8_03975 [Chitinophagales bacterium]
MKLDSSIGKKDFINTFLLVIFYAAAFYGIQFFLYKTAIFATFPTSENLVSWDAGWYQNIAKNGYSFNGSDQSNSGFFYLLPAIWNMVGANGWGMSILNTIFFATGFSILSGIYKLPMRDKLLWLSMPAVFFAFVPYAEALFFLLATLCILGIKKQQCWLIWTSLFLLSLTRATAVFAIPAFFCMELVSNNRNNWLRSLSRYITLYVFPSLAGLAVFIIIQYWKTHVWFAYFIAQSRFWKRTYANPVFPLFNGTGQRTVWLNALALFACFIAFIFLIVMLAQWLIKNKQRDKILVFSMAYLGMTLFTSLFYSPQWLVGFTDVSGTFRYAMMNPFFYVFLYYFTYQIHYKWQHYLLVFFLAGGVWMAFGAYLHIQYFLFFTANTIMIFFYMLHANKKLEWPAIVLIAINILLQAHLFQHYISKINLVD